LSKESRSHNQSKESRGHNHNHSNIANIVKDTPQQPLQRLPNIIIQENKPELKKFSTTISNEFNINGGVKKNPISEALAQDKLANKNQFFNKLNEINSVFLNNNTKMKTLNETKVFLFYNLKLYLIEKLFSKW